MAKSERQKMLDGEMYDAYDPELVVARERARELCRTLNGAIGSGESRRNDILRELLGAGGESARILSPFFCDYGENIELGEQVFFNFNCVILDTCRVRVGEFTQFGPSVQIYTALHPMDAELRRTQEYGRPVEIGADVWIGGGAIILPGVNIGDRAVIGAGSVVTRDVPPDTFAAGNPCRVMRPI